MLLFKKRFLDAIRCGRKTQTIRVWSHRRMRAGQRSYIPGVGYIQVEAVESVALSDVSEADALRDGFETLAALTCELEVIYGERLRGGWQLFRIVFAVLPAAEQTALREARRRQRGACVGDEPAASDARQGQ
jgi:hypothetical protein